ncbi:hypothetical protein GEMRC1_008993 [Eukaryota sp. GEM-RC1]
MLEIRNDELQLVKVGDYDHSCTADGTVTHQRLDTLAYMAPEVIMCHSTNANFQTDIFALGVLYWGLLTNSDPSTAAPNAALLQIQRVNHNGKALIDIELLQDPWKSLVSSMVSIKAEDRPDIGEVLAVVRDIVSESRGIKVEIVPHTVKMELEDGTTLELVVPCYSKLSELKSLVKSQTGIPKREQLYLETDITSRFVDNNRALYSCSKSTSFYFFQSKTTPSNGEQTMIIANWLTGKFVRLTVKSSVSLSD